MKTMNHLNKLLLVLKIWLLIGTQKNQELKTKDKIKRKLVKIDQF